MVPGVHNSLQGLWIGKDWGENASLRCLVWAMRWRTYMKKVKNENFKNSILLAGLQGRPHGVAGLRQNVGPPLWFWRAAYMPSWPVILAFPRGRRVEYQRISPGE